MANYRELVEFISKHLVTQPDSVTVESSEDETGTKIMIRVAHEDVGRIIGKRGATINAIRLLAKAAAVKAGEKVDVDIVEE
ncbi:MAG: KH domain-containing protein [Fretibacterium sp.]|nr:KH domain-containing protein [Fretibacterium sp.]